MSEYRITVMRTDPMSDEEKRNHRAQLNYMNAYPANSFPDYREVEALSFVADEAAFKAIRAACLQAIK